MQKRQSKGTKRKTRQAKALENARKAPRTFLELLHEVIREMLLELLFVFKLL
jgi:zinc finger HIT domain-containing protein 1